MVIALVIAAWLTLLLPLPKWLVFVLVFAFVAIGGLFAVLGGLAWYWDSHMNSSKQGVAMFVSGVLILVSQGIQIFRHGSLD